MASHHSLLVVCDAEMVSAAGRIHDGTAVQALLDRPECASELYALSGGVSFPPNDHKWRAAACSGGGGGGGGGVEKLQQQSPAATASSSAPAAAAQAGDLVSEVDVPRINAILRTNWFSAETDEMGKRARELVALCTD